MKHLYSFGIGVVTTALCALAYGSWLNDQWEHKCFDHGCGYYEWKIIPNTLKYKWYDESNFGGDKSKSCIQGMTI